jgi:hypothetical protein
VPFVGIDQPAAKRRSGAERQAQAGVQESARRSARRAARVAGHWAAQGTGPREGRAAERRRLLVVGVPLSDDIADARVALAQLAPQPGLEGGEAGGLGGVVGMAHLREQLLSLKQPLRVLRIDKSTEHQHRERR